MKVYFQPGLYALLDENHELYDACQKIQHITNRILPKGHAISSVEPAIQLSSPPSDVTNQGRGNSKNPATYEHDGLFFRSPPEIELYKALVDLGLPIMPLPVVICRGAKKFRIEPDFVIIQQGRIFVVEVDGYHTHNERPVVARERVEHLEDEGVQVIRVRAEECRGPVQAAQLAKTIKSKIERRLKSKS